MNYPYEFILRRPGVEITVRTEELQQLVKTHGQAHVLMDAASRSDEENAVFRYDMPVFLSKQQSYLKMMSYYEKKYPSNFTIDLSIELTPGQEGFSLNDEQIEKAHAHVKALMPPETRELWVITHGNLPDVERIKQSLSLSDRDLFEHHETDLGDVLRIVVLCFSPLARSFE